MADLASEAGRSGGEPVSPGPSTGAIAAGVARGGVANLLGAMVYGLSGFVLLVVLNHGIGVSRAGVVIVAIAIFSILTTVAGIGTSTGLVRTISRLRARRQAEIIPMIVRAALVPVTVAGLAAGAALWYFAPHLATLFADGDQVEGVTSVLRAMAPFVPAATLHNVVVQATRGFDTMSPQVVIEKIGRSITLPIACGAAAYAGGSPELIGALWAGTNLVALVFSWRALHVRVDRAVTAADKVPPSRRDPEVVKEFWAYTGPRAIALMSTIAVSWLDTIIVGAIVSATAAGIYASGTRYLMPGLFAGDALVQVIGPRLSGFLSTGRKREASDIVQVAGGWQVLTMWPIYLVTLTFPTPLLRVFGDEVVGARGALIALSVAMLLSAPTGPTGAVILMSGKSRQAMFNSLAVLAVNVAGNLIFVPRHGITAAGIVWAVSIQVNNVLTTWQSNRSIGIRTFGAPAFTAMAVSTVSFGLVGLTARFLWGDAWGGLIAVSIIGTVLYALGVWRFRQRLHVDSWWNGVRGRSGKRTVAVPSAQGTT
ncbi:MAG: polysaccharide biosynthesis C-terminal domain-containing protein [Acidimicrobiales bacterium]|nr:polysaccharide biosynthesis C-terminal domain-containing protein [Acidimicrobiales bacterium]